MVQEVSQQPTQALQKYKAQRLLPVVRRETQSIGASGFEVLQGGVPQGIKSCRVQEGKEVRRCENRLPINQDEKVVSFSGRASVTNIEQLRKDGIL